MSLSTGDRLGRYEVLGPIGAGGMGEVWRARDTELDREVAVKVLPESFASDETRLERFHREAKALAALTHPNLLEIYDVGSTDGIQYAVTELLEGDTLRERITPSGLPWKKVTSIGAAVADGLAAAHGRGIIHRDLKPENLFITADGRVKILDFGLASIHEAAEADAETATITEAGTVMGTPGYMAPEQVKGKQADARSDIFSLGCVIYEMASGHRAFRGETGVEVIANILKEEPPQLSSSGASVPVDLERAVHRCLEKRPEARFQSAADLSYSLKSVGLSGTAPVMATPGSGIEATTKRKYSLPQIGGIAALLILAVITSWWVLTQRGSEHVPAEVASILDPNRIAVVPFTNRTGDDSLDNLAALTTDRISQGLAELDEIKVAPASMVSATSAGVEAAVLVREVAAGTNSALVLTGVWDVVGTALELQATLEDAQMGAVVHAFDPIPVNRDAPQEAIATLRDWVLMAVQDHLHPLLAWGAGDRFPIYDAYLHYRSYLEGVGTGATQHIYQAVEIDPEFARPRILLGGSWGPDIGEYHEMFVAFFEPVREMPLNGEQQRLVSMIDARMEGRWEEAFRITRADLDRHPADPFRQWQIVRSAGWADRPLAAIEAFRTIDWDPLTPAMARTMAVEAACNAFHRLGRYDEELELIRETLDLGPAQLFGLPLEWFELRALVGLGRLDEIDPLVDEFLVMPFDGLQDPAIMVYAAHELRAHGHPEAARAMAERSMIWWDHHPDVPRRVDYSESLMSVGRIEEALAVMQKMLTECPDCQPFLTVAGWCYARLGDRNRALEIDAHLTELGEAELISIQVLGHHGVIQYRSAQIASTLGDQDRAISLLQDAVTAGFNDYLAIHIDPRFEPLWDDPDFQEILRPKE